MKYRRLGKTDLNVSVVGIGTFQMGGAWNKNFDQPEVDAVINEGRKAGINLIDTAECYGDHLAEKMIGKAIRSDRTNWVVATKFGHRRYNLLDREHLWSAADFQKQLEDSLRALQTDYIDIYQFHSGGNDVFDNDALWAMLNKQVQAGKIRSLGISLSKGSQDVQQYQTAQADRVGARTIQVLYNRLVRDAEETVFPACEKQDLGVLVRVPLESGFLTGKYDSGMVFDSSDVRAKKYDPQTTQQILTQVARIRKEEVPPKIPMPAWALAWCLQHPAVSCVIPGCKGPDHIRLNAAAADLDMVLADHPLSMKAGRG